tara:strand:+ start:126 stop:740 length:615 start_codon:yes stop_codon:yes gene_type:complete
MANTARRSDGLNTKVYDGGNGKYERNYNRFLTGNYIGMTLQTKDDAACDAGFTMVDGEYYNAKWLGDAACALVLPAAKAGAFTVFRISAACDGGQNLTVTCAGTDKYAAHTIQIPVTNLGDGLVAARTRNLPTDFTQDVALTGGTIEAGDAADTALTITATATDNQLAVGAELAFFCKDDGFWYYSFLGSELGDGSKNTNWATA